MEKWPWQLSKYYVLTGKPGEELKVLLNELILANCGAYMRNFSVLGAFLAIFEQNESSTRENPVSGIFYHFLIKSRNVV